LLPKFKVEVTKEEETRLDKKPTENSEAYSLSLKGQYKFWTLGDRQGGIDLMKKALETDPGFAEAYAQLGYAYLVADLGFSGDKSVLGRTSSEGL